MFMGNCLPMEEKKTTLTCWVCERRRHRRGQMAISSFRSWPNKLPLRSLRGRGHLLTTFLFCFDLHSLQKLSKKLTKKKNLSSSLVCDTDFSCLPL